LVNGRGGAVVAFANWERVPTIAGFAINVVHSFPFVDEIIIQLTTDIANPLLRCEWNALGVSSPKLFAIPNLNAYLAKCASVSWCECKLVVDYSTCLAVGDFDTW
jgi:hypothetical protein